MSRMLSEGALRQSRRDALNARLRMRVYRPASTQPKPDLPQRQRCGGGVRILRKEVGDA